MIKVDCEQLSPEWFAARTGVASCSGLDRIITPSMKPSAQAEDYLFELVAEFITGEKKETRASYWMQRGVEMEPEAREVYEFIFDLEVEQTGFIYRDEQKLFGCSPDGLMPRKGLEIKCPAPITHIQYLLQGVLPRAYAPQVQGALWVTGFDAWDFMSYHPDYESLIITVEPDPAWQKALDSILPPFLERLAEQRENPKVLAMKEARHAIH